MITISQKTSITLGVLLLVIAIAVGAIGVLRPAAKQWTIMPTDPVNLATVQATAIQAKELAEQNRAGLLVVQRDLAEIKHSLGRIEGALGIGQAGDGGARP